MRTARSEASTRALPRLVVAAGAAWLVLAVGVAAPAAAQTRASGTLVGHVIVCRSLPVPVGGADAIDADNPAPLADVTPGGNRRRVSSIVLPATNLQVSVAGTSLTARTDANGQFTLTGVPAAQPLTLLADVPPGGLLQLNMPDLQVDGGQTRDLGTLGLARCAQASAQFAPLPAGATAGDAGVAITPAADTATLPLEPGDDIATTPSASAPDDDSATLP